MLRMFLRARRWCGRASHYAIAMAILQAATLLVAETRGEEVAWSSKKVSRLFHGEGGTLADFDNDGHMDIAAGYLLFFGPEHSVAMPVHPSNPYNINGYSEYFFGFDHDIDKDGDQDLLAVGFPGAAAYWYRNPGADRARKGPWERFLVLDVVDNESPSFADLTGDGRPELLCCNGGHYGYAEIPSDPTKPWAFHAVSEPGLYQRFTHGMGIGDVNDDGHMDMMAKDGWWQNPGAPTEQPWPFHAFEFSGPGGAQMYAVDLDGDGKTEVITSLAAHGYGLAVYKKPASGEPKDWRRIDIMTDRVETSPTQLAISQLHAVEIADMDSDGHLDILTGKRFWAHNGNDAGENDPPMLVWFKPIPVEGSIKFVPNVIDSESGVGTQVLARDANGDGRIDVLSVSKRGVHLLTQSSAIAKSNPSHPRDDANTVAKETIAINDTLGGVRPAWTSTEAVNLDFETGDLRDWTPLGGSFFNQPVHGDAIHARQADAYSNHQGQYWIGTFEVGGDIAMGSMISRPFLVSHPWCSMLLGGGSSKDTACEIIDIASGDVVLSLRGTDSDRMERKALDLSKVQGKVVAIRLVDNSREGWGHINFDDFRLHASAPEIPTQGR